MGPGALLVVQLLTTALAHAAELNQLLATAAADGGRDVTPAEVAATRARAVAAVDALEAAIKAHAAAPVIATP